MQGTTAAAAPSCPAGSADAGGRGQKAGTPQPRSAVLPLGGPGPHPHPARWPRHTRRPPPTGWAAAPPPHAAAWQPCAGNQGTMQPKAEGEARCTHARGPVCHAPPCPAQLAWGEAGTAGPGCLAKHVCVPTSLWNRRPAQRGCARRGAPLAPPSRWRLPAPGASQPP